MDYALVGKIIGTFGIKGELKVISETSFADSRFKKGSKLLMLYNNKYVEVIINSHRVHKKMDLISFKQVGSQSLNNDINEVEKYVGCSLYINHEDLDELEDDEYYYDDLIGLIAYSEDDQLIGEVVDLRELPRGILLEIKTEKKTALVPFVDDFVVDVDLDNNKIVIKAIEGLLWE